MTLLIESYNKQVEGYRQLCEGKSNSDFPDIEKFIDYDPKKISWSGNLKADLQKFVSHELEDKSIIKGLYRPFCKQWSYFNRRFNERVYQMPKIFPHPDLENWVICVTGIGASKGFSTEIAKI